MKAVSTIAAAVLAITLAAACGEADVLGVINRDCETLLGDFQATSFIVTSTEGPPTTVDMLADGGQFNLAFGKGIYSSSYKAHAGFQNVNTEGVTSGSTGTSLRLSSLSVIGTGGANQRFKCQMSGGNVMKLEASTTYQFPGEVTPRPADFKITLALHSQPI